MNNPDRSLWDKFLKPKPKEETTKEETTKEYVAFCLQCGAWMTTEDVEIMKKTKRCPDENCVSFLFRYNDPGARERWEEEVEEIKNRRRKE